MPGMKPGMTTDMPCNGGQYVHAGSDCPRVSGRNGAAAMPTM
jgi:hypothetical protein